jgi:formate dehydrogenase major subunit
MGVLNNYTTGYLNYPLHTEPTLAAWTDNNGTSRRKYLVNMLKAFFGDAATPENDFAYGWLPKRNAAKDHSIYGIFESALAGQMKMLWIVGQNPAVTSPNLRVVFDALAKLDMLVVQEIWDTETSSFWHRPGVDPKTVQTEVLLLPASFFMEKNGTITNSGAMVQWRHAAVKPPGKPNPTARSSTPFSGRVRDLVHDSKLPQDEIINKAFWTYTTAEDVLREINGRALVDLPAAKLKAGDLVSKTSDLQADGTTSSGCWIYAGVFTGGENLSKRRDSRTDPGDLGLYPNFGWTWPNNMRVLYNRASCDRTASLIRARSRSCGGTKRKALGGLRHPGCPRADRRSGHAQRTPFVPHERRRCRRLFAAVYEDPDWKSPDGLPRDASYVPKDGPLPEMYEPVESPVENVLHPKVRHNPILKYPRIEGYQPIGTSDKFPYVLMTSTVAEHWCAGSTHATFLG